MIVTLCSYLGYVEDKINQSVSNCVGWIISQPFTSGTGFPPPSFVVRRLLKNVPQGTDDSPARSILEADPGSGDVTRHLVERLGKNDKLVLVEYDKPLCEELKELFKKQIQDGLVELFNAAVQNIGHWNPSNRKFDLIVSTSPFNSSVNDLREIFQAFQKIANPNCLAEFTEYAGLSTLRNLIAWVTRDSITLEITAEKIQFFNDHAWASEIEIRNMPPVRVIHCMLNRNQ